MYNWIKREEEERKIKLLRENKWISAENWCIRFDTSGAWHALIFCFVQCKQRSSGPSFPITVHCKVSLIGIPKMYHKFMKAATNTRSVGKVSASWWKEVTPPYTLATSPRHTCLVFPSVWSRARGTAVGHVSHLFTDICCRTGTKENPGFTRAASLHRVKIIHDVQPAGASNL